MLVCGQYAWVDAARVVSSQIVYLRGMRQAWETQSDAESTLIGRLGQAVRAMESFASILPIFSAYYSSSFLLLSMVY